MATAALEAYAQAVVVSFDLAASSTAATREMLYRAHAYCEQTETGPQGCNLALRLLCQSTDPRIGFHCLQVLQRKLEDDGTWALLQKSGDNITVRLALLQRDASQDPRFVRTKMGVVLALFVKREFPASWPSAFDDLLATVSRNQGAADVFLWTMMALEEDVIGMAAGTAEAADLKDAMRVDAVRKLAQGFIHLFASYGESDADVARRALGCLGAMVAWADIGLVADNASFIGLVLERLANANFAASVLQFMCRLVHKGMPAHAKVRLIARLGLADVVIAMAGALARNELHVSAPALAAPARAEAWQGLPVADAATSLETARLVDVLGAELLSARKTAFDAHDDGLLQSVTPLLERVVWAMFACLECSEFQVQGAVVEFANLVNGRLQNPAHATRLAYAVVSSARYPADYDFALDDDDDFVDHRRLVKRLFISVCRQAGQQAVLPFFASALPAMFNPSSSPVFAEFSQAESLLFCLHAFAEGCPELAQRQGPPDAVARFDALLAYVFKSNAPLHPHHAVVIMFNELAARYAACLKAQPLDVVQHVVGLLSGAGGVYHAHAKVRSRACGVLLRLVRALVDKGAPLFEPLLVALQPALDLGFDRAGGRDCSDALVLYDAVAVLMNAHWGAPLRRGAVGVIVLPLQSNLETARTQWQLLHGDDDARGGGERDRLAAWLVVTIEALSIVVKGFAHSRDDDVAAVLARGLQSALLAAQTVRPSSSSSSPVPNKVAGNVRRLCHALIPSLGIALVAYLPEIRAALLDPPDAEVGKTCDLINQMMATFRAAMAPALSEALVPLLRSINAHLSPLLSVANPSPNDRVEARELERVLLTMLHSIASCELSSVLLAEPNRPHLFELLGLLADALGSLPDPGPQRVCAITFQHLAKDWLPQSPERDQTAELHASIVRFMYERATPASFRATTLPTFDPQDAACATLLVAVCSLHRTLYERCGREWLNYLARVFLPSVACPADVAEDYCNAIVNSKSPKDLRSAYRSLFLVAR